MREQAGRSRGNAEMGEDMDIRLAEMEDALNNEMYVVRHALGDKL